MSGELHKVFGKPDIYQCIFVDPYNTYYNFPVFAAPQLTTTPGPGDPKEQAASDDDDDDLALSKGK